MQPLLLQTELDTASRKANPVVKPLPASFPASSPHRALRGPHLSQGSPSSNLGNTPPERRVYPRPRRMPCDSCCSTRMPGLPDPPRRALRSHPVPASYLPRFAPWGQVCPTTSTMSWLPFAALAQMLGVDPCLAWNGAV